MDELLGFAGKVVMKDCATRWNSSLSMIDRLLDFMVELEVVLKNLNEIHFLIHN